MVTRWCGGLVCVKVFATNRICAILSLLRRCNGLAGEMGILDIEMASVIALITLTDAAVSDAEMVSC